MEIRWVVRRRQLTVTAVDVLEYSERVGCSLMDAKRMLMDEDAPVLQVLEHGVWVDVPTVTVKK